MLELPKFDELLKMAKDNPEALETLRQAHIDDLINNAPEHSQKRLRGLQFQIDAHRSIHHDSPMGSCIKISHLMNQSFNELREHLNQIADLDDPLRELTAKRPTLEESRQSAEILAFPTSAKVC